MLTKHRGVKFTFAFECKFKNTETGEISTPWKQVKSMTIYDMKQLPQMMSLAVSEMKAKVANTDKPELYQLRFERITKVGLNVVKYVPFRGSQFIKTPKFLQLSTNNPNNKDFECFKWAVLIALHHKEITKYKKNPGNIAAYKEWENDFDFKGITKMDKGGKWLEGVDPHGRGLDKWERENDVAVNIHHREKQKVLSLRRSKLKTDFGWCWPLIKSSLGVFFSFGSTLFSQHPFSKFRSQLAFPNSISNFDSHFQFQCP